MELAPPIESPRRITLRDVAKAANLSVASVSLALRGQPRISAETKAHITAVARSIGYQANPALSSLSAYRSISRKKTSTVIGLVFSGRTTGSWNQHPPLPALIASARLRANEYGYDLEPIWYDETLTSSHELDQTLGARKIHGLIWAINGHPVPSFNSDWRRYLTVSIGRPNGAAITNFTELDYQQNLLLCLQQLRSRGYRRIGLLVPPTQTARTTSQNLYASHFAWMTRTLTLPAIPPLGLRGLSADDGQQWLRRWQPDAIISSIPNPLNVLPATLPGSGAKIAYASLDTTGESSITMGINPHHRLLGSVAVDMLHRQFLHDHSRRKLPPVGTRICGTWSDGPANTRSQALCPPNLTKVA